MTGTERESLIAQVRQMAGASAFEPPREEAVTVLPDGYRRRSSVQSCRQGPPRFPTWAVVLFGVLSAVLLCLIAYALLQLIRK